jgi:hypothetical protein
VSKEEGEALAEKHGVEFYETSARDSNNINRLFTTAATVAFQACIDKPRDFSRSFGLNTTTNSGRTILRNKNSNCC